jgi:hypothetical protein
MNTVSCAITREDAASRHYRACEMHGAVLFRDSAAEVISEPDDRSTRPRRNRLLAFADQRYGTRLKEEPTKNPDRETILGTGFSSQEPGATGQMDWLVCLGVKSFRRHILASRAVNHFLDQMS